MEKWWERGETPGEGSIARARSRVGIPRRETTRDEERERSARGARTAEERCQLRAVERAASERDPARARQATGVGVQMPDVRDTVRVERAASTRPAKHGFQGYRAPPQPIPYSPHPSPCSSLSVPQSCETRFARTHIVSGESLSTSLLCPVAPFGVASSIMVVDPARNERTRTGLSAKATEAGRPQDAPPPFPRGRAGTRQLARSESTAGRAERRLLTQRVFCPGVQTRCRLFLASWRRRARARAPRRVDPSLHDAVGAPSRGTDRRGCGSQRTRARRRPARAKQQWELAERARFGPARSAPIAPCGCAAPQGARRPTPAGST